MEVYKEKFFNTLIENIKGLEGKLTTNKEHSLTRTLKNTCLFAQDERTSRSRGLGERGENSSENYQTF